MAQYFEFAALDDKPEKGERKMADEQALLVAEILENYIVSTLNKSRALKMAFGQKDSESEQETLHLDLFKVCFLELAYEQSCYNFDIQLLILKSFDRLGFSASYSEVYDTLGLKGV